MIRNLQLPSLFILVASLFWLTGCEEEEVIGAAPSAEITVSGGLQASYEAGDQVEFTVTFSSENELSSVIVNQSVNGGTPSRTFLNPQADLGLTDLSSGTFTFTYLIDETLENSDIELFFEFVDMNELTTTSDSYSFSVEASVNVFSARLIGGFLNNSLGSSYDAEEDSVYSASSLRGNQANQEKIDFLYYFVDSQDVGAVIASPDNDEAETTWGTQASGEWPFLLTENATRFNTSPAVSFASATSSADLEAAFGEVGNDLTRVVNLVAEQEVAFQTADGTYGIFVVNAVTGTSGADRAIEIDVKVQRVL